MSDDRALSDRLREIPIEDEAQSEERGWRVVSAAYGERYPTARPRRVRRLVLALAASAVLLALALTPAGADVVDAVEDVIGVAEEDARPALRSLPTAGELLVDSASGPWIVREDGSKRLLGDYRRATWSPRGLFVAATDGRQLAAVDLLGDVRWTVTAPGRVDDPRWSPSGVRIAYRSDGDLRVVAGDGTDDHVVARDVAPVAPAWRPVADAKLAQSVGEPGTEQVSYVDRHGRPRLVDADTGAEPPEAPRPSLVPRRYGRIDEIAWSAGGERIVASSKEAVVTDAPGRGGFFAYVASGRAEIEAVALAPGGERIAMLESNADRGEIRLVELGGGEKSIGRALFAGPGTIDGLTWSPDGRWLLTGWRDADQWLFIRADRPRRLVAFDEVSSQFDPGGDADRFPRVEGWILPQR